MVASGFQEVEVRKGDEAFCVNLHIKKCNCRMCELSGIPCVHAMAAYFHMKKDPVLGVSEWYSKNKWVEAYQYSIRPVLGSKYWKPSTFPKPLPPLERKMPGRPRKKRIRHPTEDDHEISRVGRIMHCHNCWEPGHNKRNCDKPAKPRPPKQNQSNPAPTEQPTNTNLTPEHFVEQMPTYIPDPALPKKRAPKPGGSSSKTGTKRCASANVNKLPKRSNLGGSSSQHVFTTTPEVSHLQT